MFDLKKCNIQKIDIVRRLKLRKSGNDMLQGFAACQNIIL